MQITTTQKKNDKEKHKISFFSTKEIRNILLLFKKLNYVL